MELWPAMRLAVAEQWGGHESADKRDFLITHICDEYSTEYSSAEQEASSSTTVPPKSPDVDDLAETLEMYFGDEFESRIEDGSADWIANRLVHLHRIIYSQFPPTKESLAQAEAELNKLNEAAVQLRGQKVVVESSQEQPQEVDDDDSDDSEQIDHHPHVHVDDAMDIDSSGASQANRGLKEPIVDEEGFTTVVKGRRR